MNMITIGWWALVNVITIDILARLLQRHTRETRRFKAANLAAMMIMALTRNQVQLSYRSASLKRFCLASLAVLALMLSCFWLLRDGLPLKRDFAPLSIALLPLLAMPFYHVLFGLLGNNIIAVSASLKHFRLRAMLSLVIGANIVALSLILQQNLVIQALHLILALLALAHILYLSSLPRARSTFYNLSQEDFDTAQGAFMNYVASILEFFYSVLIIYFAFGPSFVATLAPSKPEYLAIPVFIGIIYIASLLIAKLFLISRALLSTDFYEDRVVPLSFLLFGIVFIYQLNF